jgi:hypothetical protein
MIFKRLPSSPDRQVKPAALGALARCSAIYRRGPPAPSMRTKPDIAARRPPRRAGFGAKHFDTE